MTALETVRASVDPAEFRVAAFRYFYLEMPEGIVKLHDLTDRPKKVARLLEIAKEVIQLGSKDFNFSLSISEDETKIIKRIVKYEQRTNSTQD